MSSPINVNDIRLFFEEVSPRSTLHLCRINPKKERSAPIAENAPSIDDAIEWIDTYNSRGHNIYEQFNPPGKTFRKKAKRDDVRWLYGFHLDWDLPLDCDDPVSWLENAMEQASSIKGVKGRPHVIMTGNGIQCRWPFAKPIRATDDLIMQVENINARIARMLNADRCHNVERLLRVPGTTNWPDEKKKREGRVPVMAELWQVSQDDFTFEDFAHLPAAPRRDEVVDNRWRIDYTARDYEADDYVPVTWAEILREDPLIVSHAMEMMKAEDNRSRAAYGLINDIIRAIAHIFNEKPDDWLEDPDVYKNISELVLDAADEEDAIYEIWGHYEDQKDPYHKLGYDVRKTLLYACDGEVNTPRTQRKAKQKRDTEAALATPHDELPIHEHRKEFIVHMRGSMEPVDLPNVTQTADGVPSSRQQATESNIREIFRRGGVIPRWNVMRDEASYDITPRAGRKAAGDDAEKAEKRVTAPRRHFHNALRRVAPDMLSASQESLLMDAMHERGITARRELSKLFEIAAKEDRFHPIEDYCKSHAWDGEGRIAQVAACLKSSHPLRDTYIRLFFRQCVAAVKSLERYKLDGSGEMLGSVPVLIGEQGMGKSSFWAMLIPPGMKSEGESLKLGGHKEADTKRAVLSGLVAILDEIGAGLDFSEQEDVKNFITARADSFRVAYAHWPTNKPRMTVLVGTSNELHLKDATGSRRFLAMEIDGIDFDRLNELMADPGFLQQCYAEAWHEVMEEGAIWWLDSDEDKIRARENAKHQDQSEEEAALEGYFNMVGERHDDEWLTMMQIFAALEIKYTPVKARRAGEYLQKVEGCEYKASHKLRDGRTVYRVWEFPCTTDTYVRVTGR